MIIKWIDKRSVLSAGKRIYKEGDLIPSGLLSSDRIADMRKMGKLEIVDAPVPVAEEQPVAKGPGRSGRPKKGKAAILEAEKESNG